VAEASTYPSFLTFQVAGVSCDWSSLKAVWSEKQRRGGRVSYTHALHTHTGSQAQQRVGHICPWSGNWSAKREEEYTGIGIGRRRERARKHMDLQGVSGV